MIDPTKMTRAEMMALEVLRGDLAAARALADLLLEEYGAGAAEVLPIKQHKIEGTGLRAVFVTNPSLGSDVTIGKASLEEAYDKWLHEGKPLGLVGCTMELYSLPDVPMAKGGSLEGGWPMGKDLEEP